MGLINYVLFRATDDVDLAKPLKTTRSLVAKLSILRDVVFKNFP